MADAYRTYTTSQLAEAAAVGPQTLRYYERRGLLPEPPRTPGGHRVYGRKHLNRVLFIQRAQALGFDLEEIHELLQLQTAGRSPGEDRVIARIDERMESLQEMRRSLVELRSETLE